MTDQNLSEEGKVEGGTPGSFVPAPVEGEGGPVKKRKADLNKEVDPKAETLPEPPLTEGKDEDEDADVEDKDEDEDDADEVVKESSAAVLSVFEGVELSEETKRKLVVVFEAAVATEANALVEAKLKAAKAALVEAHKAELNALKEAHEAEKTVLEENLNTFMEDASAKWLEENKIAIQDAKTVEIAEAFVNSMKDLFVEHEILVDVDNAQTLSAMEEEIEAANARANEAIMESMAARKELKEMKAEAVFTEISEGLTTSQVDKLRLLSSKLVMEDVESFKTDLVAIKETFFNNAAPSNLKEEVEEDPVVTDSAPVASNLSEDFVVSEMIKAINARKNS